MNNNISSQYPFQSQSPYGNSPANNNTYPVDPRYQNTPHYPSVTPSYIMPSLVQQPALNYIKCRPVASIDEARAAQVDLDGQLNVFTDIGNKKIYTKQINLDGTASLNTYVLTVEEDNSKNEYVTKKEFDAVIKEFQNLLISMQPPASNAPVVNDNKVTF